MSSGSQSSVSKFQMRVWYIGCALSFQVREEDSISSARSILMKKPKKKINLNELIPQTIYLSKIDYDFFLEQINNPPAPSPALIALMQGKKLPTIYSRHKYIPETSSGIGFCSVCHSDNINDGNHI